MAANTIEAVLVSRYVDHVSAGVRRTMDTMRAGIMTMAAGAQAAVDGMVSSWINFGLQMMNVSRQGASASQGLAWRFAALGVVVTGVFARIATAAASFLADITRQASEVLELKLAFESLTATMGVAADTMMGDLKRATEGLVSSTILLRNANRVLSADIPLTSQQYVQLVSSIFKLSKAAGVDAAQAIQTLTDALIRGNARGLQALGLNLGSVRDAISQMAEATGQSTSKVEADAKLRVFYNELLRATSSAAQKNAADYFSLTDAFTKSQNVFKAWVNSIGEAIGRSEVFEQLLQRLSRALDDMGPSASGVEKMALAVNRALIDMMQLLARILDLITAFGPVWASLYAGLKALGGLAFYVLNLILGVVVHVVGRLVEVLSLIPRIGEMFKPVVAEMARLRDQLLDWRWRGIETFQRSFDGFGSGVIALERMSESLKSTAREMERFAGSVVRGAASTGSMRRETERAALTVEQLKEQTKKYNELASEFQKRWVTPPIQATLDYIATLNEINRLTAVSERRKNVLREEAFRAWLKRMRELDKEARDKAFVEWKEQWELERMLLEHQKDLSRMPQPPQRPDVNLGSDPFFSGHRQAELARMQEWQRAQEALQKQMDRNTPDWAKPVRDLHLELDKLNQIRMDPFHQTIGALRSGIADFASGAGQAFANFFSDLVSGQENAGKKLLAAFLGMIGQMLVKQGVFLIQAGIAEMALASTFVGKMMGASHAAGARAVATGTVMAALGGAMVGAAAVMAQTNRAGAGATFQENVPRPISGAQVQVIEVGAAGRAQSRTEVQQQQPKELGTLMIKLDRGLIVQEVKSNIQANGPLRTVIQNI
ncbi:MAG: hypothetical protein KatS3mg005_3425 [Bryobacteraceae bacterium]|jgi:hypothetical protein|nr:MAG: hypothetical protein KatS3mg005_3425 [Bryobacteraceae bacterium]